MIGPDYAEPGAQATLACQRGRKRAGCPCPPCAVRRALFGANAPCQVQEVRRALLASGEIGSLHDGSKDAEGRSE